MQKFFSFSQNFLFQFFSIKDFPFSPNISLKKLSKIFLSKNDKYFLERE